MAKREPNPLLDAWHDAMGNWPNSVQRKELEATVTDIPLFKECLRVWRLRGFSPMNAMGIIKWYNAGGPPQNGKPRPTSTVDSYLCSVCHRSPCRCDGEERVVSVLTDDTELAQAWFVKQEELRFAGLAHFFEGAKPIGRDADGRLIIEPTSSMREKMLNTHPSVSGRIANILKTAREMDIVVRGGGW